MTTAAAAPARPWTKFYSVGMRNRSLTDKS